MFLCPLTGWTAATGKDLLDFARGHAEALRRPCRFIATAAHGTSSPSCLAAWQMAS